MIPKFWNFWKHLPIYCITRHPYERFNSQLAFIPILMAKDGPDKFFKETHGASEQLLPLGSLLLKIRSTLSVEPEIFHFFPFFSSSVFFEP